MAEDDFDKAIDLAGELASGFKFDLNIRQGQAMIEALEDYDTAFKKFVSLTMTQWEADKKMVGSARKARKICGEARETQKRWMQDKIVFSEMIIIAGTSLSLIIGLFAAFFIAQSIIVPVRQVTEFAGKLSRGDLSDRISAGKPVNCSVILDCDEKACVCFGREAYCWVEAGSFSSSPACPRVIQGQDCHTCKAYKKAARNEFQEMGLALNAMAEAMKVKADAAAAVAGGDLTQDISVASRNDILGKSLRDMVRGLNDLIRQVNEAAFQIDAGATQVSDSGNSLSEGTTEQAASLEQATSSMIEIGSQIKSSAENASRVSRFAEEARNAARQGAKEMANMTSAMEDINDAAQSIAKIIKVIDEIAFQTNLLALNAAVEAARAGRHGKGFAVVAEEVRNLASRSAKAAKETAELIEGTVTKVKRGNEMAGQTAEVLSRIVESSVRVAELVAEIAASCNEQSYAIDQVNQGLGQIDQVTQQNAANAEQTASSAEELDGLASQLRYILTQFKLNVSGSDHPQTIADCSPSGTSDRNQPSDMMPVKSEDARFPSQTDARYMALKEIMPLDDEDFEEY